MKCTNCGAELQIDGEKRLKFCPYCGNEVKDEDPTTWAGAVHSIAQSAIKEISKQMDGGRDFIKEEEDKDRKETKWIVIGLVIAMIALFTYIHFQAEREREEKKQTQNNTSIVYELKEADIYV